MKEEPKVEKMAISKEKKEGTQEELFDFIVESIAVFLKKYKIDRKLPLGFTFSFPVVQTSLTAGTLKKWTKDFNAAGAEGEEVIKLLRAAIARRQVSLPIPPSVFPPAPLPDNLPFPCVSTEQ